MTCLKFKADQFIGFIIPYCCVYLIQHPAKISGTWYEVIDEALLIFSENSIFACFYVKVVSVLDKLNSSSKLPCVFVLIQVSGLNFQKLILK